MQTFITMISTGRRGRKLVVAAAFCILVVTGVHAQGLAVPGGSSGDIGGRFKKSAPDKPSIAPADAMPGAKARAPAAPATRPVGDMAPTEALFDAINRGDIASARDALNRGADLNGVNILGMTPMELSVDLGRNDISFLLLSMRGEDSSRGSQLVGRDGGGTAARKPPVPADTAARAVRQPNQLKPERVAAKPVATPKLFANDGGRPLPDAGFLGFDSRSGTN